MKKRENMYQQQIQILHDILNRPITCYMTVHPLGIDPGNNRKLITDLDCRILNYGTAKTLYRQKRQICRSLDAVKAIGKSNKNCQRCPDYQKCTNLIRLDLLFENRPYGLLIAYSSAKNFLLYTSKIAEQKIKIYTIATKIVVINRGSWGELRFFRTNTLQI